MAARTSQSSGVLVFVVVHAGRGGAIDSAGKHGSTEGVPRKLPLSVSPTVAPKSRHPNYARIPKCLF
eukprot:6212401-Alexandrium_andersonii.AAC.1